MPKPRTTRFVSERGPPIQSSRRSTAAKMHSCTRDAV